MRYVIIRDDDTNALTPFECLERLYRPFLDRSFPENLAVIPDVATSTTMPNGQLEGYLLAGARPPRAGLSGARLSQPQQHDTTGSRLSQPQHSDIPTATPHAPATTAARPLQPHQSQTAHQNPKTNFTVPFI